MTKIMKTNDLEVSHPHNCSSSTRPFLINCKFEAIPARTNKKLNPHVAVPDSDLEIRKGKGGGGGCSLPENFFRPFGPQVWSKNKGGPPLDPPLCGIPFGILSKLCSLPITL